MARRYTVTARAAAMAVAIGVVVLALALPLKVFLSQQATVSRLRAQTSAEAGQVSALRAALRQWADPAYVEAQARDRLHMVLPGQTTYLVMGGSNEPAAPQPQTTHPTAADLAWYTQLWGSLSAVGKADNRPQATSAGG